MCSRHANVLQEFEHTKPLSPNPHFQRAIGPVLGITNDHIRPAAKHETYYVSRFHYWRAISKKKKTQREQVKREITLGVTDKRRFSETTGTR